MAAAYSAGKIPSSISCQRNGAKRQDVLYKRSISAGLSRPWDGPAICRLVLVKPGCAALEMMPQPAARLRRSSSRANIKTASFDWP
ncbi:Uncharacterised protein [Mycobacterium tuberculosis]|nr:Uncharacterised protein [Mycobacterium tuberculosis]CNV38991.1 Uncharacterised protein [Mycobacterium tuberculosis]CNW17196.1 Uncharacterised protein [Mycobacterium tuberculosis]